MRGSGERAFIACTVDLLEAGVDIERLNQDLISLAAGEEGETPVFNFLSGKREPTGKKVRIPKDDIIVLEGIHCLNHKFTYALPKENMFKIYISCLTTLNIDDHNRIPTTDARLLRRMTRDARTRGYSASATIAMWPSVRRGEESHIFPFQDSADVVFKNAEGTASETVKVNQEAHAKAWTLLSKWPIQSTANKSYYSSAWKAHSPEYGEMPHETQGTIIFDHRASVAAGTTSDKNNALDVPTSSSAFKPHDPRAYGTWDGDFWNLESLQGASAGEKIRVFFELAGSANTMGYWKMEYLDGSEWKIAGPSHTVSYKGSDVTYTHRMYDQSDTEHASGGNAGFIPFEAEATLTADVEKVTFRLTAVTTYCTDGVTARTAVSEGGEGTSGWIMLVASAPEGGTAADHHPHIEVFR